MFFQKNSFRNFSFLTIAVIAFAVTTCVALAYPPVGVENFGRQMTADEIGNFLPFTTYQGDTLNGNTYRAWHNKTNLTAVLRGTTKGNAWTDKNTGKWRVDAERAAVCVDWDNKKWSSGCWLMYKNDAGIISVVKIGDPNDGVVGVVKPAPKKPWDI